MPVAWRWQRDLRCPRDSHYYYGSGTRKKVSEARYRDESTAIWELFRNHGLCEVKGKSQQREEEMKQTRIIHESRENGLSGTEKPIVKMPLRREPGL